MMDQAVEEKMNKEKRIYPYKSITNCITSNVLWYKYLLDVDRISFIKYINIQRNFCNFTQTLSLLILGLKVFNCIKLKDPKKY